jgi:hypothetical protein
MIITCSPYPATDYRIVTVKTTNLASTETPKPYTMMTNTYNEGDHLYWRTSVTMEDDGTTKTQEIAQTLNANGFPTNQVITNYNGGSELETKQFITYVYDEKLFLPTTIDKFEGTSDATKVATEKNTLTYDENGLLLSIDKISFESDGTTKNQEMTIKNLIPKNTKKIHEQLLGMGEMITTIYQGIFIPSSMKDYEEGVLATESVINFDADGYPTTMVQTDHTQTPAVVTTLYFKNTITDGKLALIELFTDDALTTPPPGEQEVPSKLAYTYDSEGIIDVVDTYYYISSAHTLMQKGDYTWVGFPEVSRNGNLPAFTISTFNGTSLQEAMKMDITWTGDLTLSMKMSLNAELGKALVDVQEMLITFEKVNVN